jgi:hypothetical protein
MFCGYKTKYLKEIFKKEGSKGKLENQIFKSGFEE